MPNHVTNILSAGKTVLDQICTTKDGKDVVDFEKIIPMPEGIKKSEAEWGTPGHRLIKDISIQFKDKLDDLTTEKDKTAAKQYFSNYIDTGHLDWYDWSCANWGTKWNAYDAVREDDHTVHFDTAWAAPLPVIKELAAKYPNETIRLEYADEDIGSNCGIVNIERNKAPEHITEDDATKADVIDSKWLKFALGVKGQSLESYMGGENVEELLEHQRSYDYRKLFLGFLRQNIPDTTSLESYRQIRCLNDLIETVDVEFWDLKSNRMGINLVRVEMIVKLAANMYGSSKPLAEAEKQLAAMQELRKAEKPDIKELDKLHKEFVDYVLFSQTEAPF